MASIQNDLRLFGLDLRHLGRDLRRAGRVLQQSPLLSWLTPEPTVRLLHSDGQASSWRMGASPSVQPGVPSARPAPFTAVELPQDLFLQKELSLPALADDQVAAAVSLEAQSASPFAADDLAWGHRAEDAANGQLRVVAVMASRRQVESHLHACGRAGGGDEVWAFADRLAQPIILQGFGEAKRLRHTAARRNLGCGLLATAVILAAAVAFTPTAQLRLRALEAMRIHAELVQRTAPLVEKRAALMQSIEQVKGLSQELAGRIDPLRVVEMLTKVLPDDTAVQNLKLQGAKVTMSGVTADASSLMQLLGAQAGLRDVRAPSAATRTAGAQRESFVIEFSLDPALFNVETVNPAPADAASSAPAAPAQDPPPQNPPPQAAQPGQPTPSFGGAGATFGGAPTAAPPAAPAPAPNGSKASKP